MRGKSADNELRDEGDSKKPAKPSSSEVRQVAGGSCQRDQRQRRSLSCGPRREVPLPPADNSPEKSPPKNSADRDPGKRPSRPSTLPETGPDLKSPPTAPGRDSKSPDTKTLLGGPLAGPPPAKVPVEGTKPGTPPVNPVVPPPAPQDKSKIGRFIATEGQDVLLRLETGDAGWRRVLPEEFLAGGQPLLSLPTYRPRIVVLNAGAALEPVNGTRIELLSDNGQGLPGVDVDFGCLVIKPSAQEGTRLRVVVGPHAGTITLNSGESIAGLEVTRVHDPGKDPEKAFSHPLTKLYVARGSAVWQEVEGKQPIRLSAPAELVLDGVAADAPLGAGKSVPNWITANTVNERDQHAARDVSQALSAERAAGLGLMELTEHRRKEVRALAARCLGYLGQFDPIVADLYDPDYYPFWSDFIDQLKEAIARGPETAAAIRQSLENKYGNDAAALYRMLWGYTDKDLEDGEDARLVKYLDDESPIFRILAFWNLKDITHKTFSYPPEATTAAKRLNAVQQWRRRSPVGLDPLQCARREAAHRSRETSPQGERSRAAQAAERGRCERSQPGECRRIDRARVDRARADRARRSGNPESGNCHGAASAAARERSRARSAGNARSNRGPRTAAGNHAVAVDFRNARPNQLFTADGDGRSSKAVMCMRGTLV